MKINIEKIATFIIWLSLAAAIAFGYLIWSEMNAHADELAEQQWQYRYLKEQESRLESDLRLNKIAQSLVADKIKELTKEKKAAEEAAAEAAKKGEAEAKKPGEPVNAPVNKPTQKENPRELR